MISILDLFLYYEKTDKCPVCDSVLVKGYWENKSGPMVINLSCKDFYIHLQTMDFFIKYEELDIKFIFKNPGFNFLLNNNYMCNVLEPFFTTYLNPIIDFDKLKTIELFQ